MEKLRKMIFNVFFYLTVVAIMGAVLFLMILFVMKLNVCAATGVRLRQTCVVIDPGHGAEDGGAVSDSGIVEKDVNLAVSLCLRDYLEASGFKVKMTRSDDDLAGTGDTLKQRLHDDFAERLKLYNDGDIVVSVHQNKFTESKYSGAQVFYSPNDEQSKVLADYMRKSIVGFLQPENTRDITEAGSNIYLLNNCSNPCILIECGFLSNPEETALLNTEEYQKQMAFTIYCGMLDCIKNS